MATSPLQPELANADSTHQQGNFRFALIALTSLFFMWGFLTCLNDILIPYLKNMFDLNYTQAMLVQFCFFGAYFIVSIPAGALVGKIGYQKGIITGLVIACVGCLLFYPSASYGSYNMFLFAFFILASGITILQVSANPYVSVLGPAETASSRLTLTQAFNSLGTTVAPFFGSWLILSTVEHDSKVTEVGEVIGQLSVQQQASAVQTPYLILAAALFVLAFIFMLLKLPLLGKRDTQSTAAVKGSAWQYPHLVLGAVGIFVYVGAEVGIGSFLISFITKDGTGGVSESQAAHYIAYYFGGAMVGRFIGAAVMQKIKAGKVLAFNALCACILVAAAILSAGTVAMWALLLVGLCNSIMFPTIFSLALQDLKRHTSQGSGILCLAIVGGAVLPLLQGMLADSMGIQFAFILPLLCYGFIGYYGLIGCDAKRPVFADKV
ncbi:MULTISPECIES: L-fucose:H+ symporter permease [Shewanella]|jgi:FHS family L-fucose permease-like MFS transporter|uniref:Glucose/galactose transporter n=2 Tax=Shewanella frigidimarina TaxID=56812 RepID=Q084Z5_SHEFN|nr:MULTISPECIES: L-fucose:H+ symporter permease [Shewanella]ABI71170.1 glucose/galactose transporter [Shewanella frigidimarina NCIMB 400]KVX00353.1 MFS transporter [Shewanella frigidimarina]MBB1426724.1 L-fucose:H+ symporter permease [Shewanella sp. SG44-2]RPA30625.1 L-fucose:H+ symporter permease [Shewanella frigidimarina]RPA62709.1 L-fucose:H+ symporter permease [Shewanella frigidimarina]|tara:strand:+ start:198035 stop:199342 length:1308 start_codon:yes stop_codon:yes gene_type:complete